MYTYTGTHSIAPTPLLISLFLPLSSLTLHPSYSEFSDSSILGLITLEIRALFIFHIVTQMPLVMILMYASKI